MSQAWNNEAAIAKWGKMPRDALAALDPNGDFAKENLLNPVLMRLLGDVSGARVLDAGCGQGYFSRLLARRGAHVFGVEPADSLFEYATESERESPLGIRYVKEDLSELPDLGRFTAVVASMVFVAIPEWRSAMRRCVESLEPGGVFVFSLTHPCFEGLRSSWLEHGYLRVDEYLREYEIVGPSASDFHRPLSDYLNHAIALGCHLVEICEPGLDPATAIHGPRGIDAYVRVPNFIVIAARYASISSS